MRSLGPYVLSTRLSSGALGELFLARRADDESGDEPPLVLKAIRPDLADGLRFRRLLNVESAAGLAFRHPGAVPLLDAGREGDQDYLVSPLVRGQPLSAILRRALVDGAQIEQSTVVWLAAQVAACLAAAHEVPWFEGAPGPLVHGAVSPRSILVGYDGQIQIAGIGHGRARATVAPSGPRLPYTAPEVLQGREISPRTDVYGLAMVVHDALSGRAIYRGRDAEATRAAVLAGNAPPLPPRRLTVSPLVGDIVQEMMAPRVEARPEDLASVQRVFRSAADEDDATYRAELKARLGALFREEREVQDRLLGAADRATKKTRSSPPTPIQMPAVSRTQSGPDIEADVDVAEFAQEDVDVGAGDDLGAEVVEDLDVDVDEDLAVDVDDDVAVDVDEDLGGEVDDDVAVDVDEDLGGEVDDDVAVDVDEDLGGELDDVAVDVGGGLDDDLGGDVDEDLGGELDDDLGGDVDVDVDDDLLVAPPPEPAPARLSAEPADTLPDLPVPPLADALDDVEIVIEPPAAVTPPPVIAPPPPDPAPASAFAQAVLGGASTPSTLPAPTPLRAPARPPPPVQPPDPSRPFAGLLSGAVDEGISDVFEAGLAPDPDDDFEVQIELDPIEVGGGPALSMAAEGLAVVAEPEAEPGVAPGAFADSLSLPDSPPVARPDSPVAPSDSPPYSPVAPSDSSVAPSDSPPESPSPSNGATSLADVVAGPPRSVPPAAAEPAGESGSEELGEGGRVARYRIVRQIPTPQNRSRFFARDPALSRDVWVDVLLEEHTSDPRLRPEIWVDRFKQEARWLAQVSHPRLPTVLDAGRERGRFFTARTPILGSALVADGERIAPWSAEAVRRLLLEVAEALDALHHANLCAGGVTPADLWRDQEARVVLADLPRLHALRGPEHPLLARELAVLPPEYMAGGGFGRSGDLFSLGLLAVQLLTGEDPLPTDPKARVESLERGQVAVPKLADPVLQDALRQLLAPSPMARFARASEVVAFLELERESSAPSLATSTPDGVADVVLVDSDVVPGHARRVLQARGIRAAVFTEVTPALAELTRLGARSLVVARGSRIDEDDIRRRVRQVGPKVEVRFVPPAASRLVGPPLSLEGLAEAWIQLAPRVLALGAAEPGMLPTQAAQEMAGHLGFGLRVELLAGLTAAARLLGRRLGDSPMRLPVPLPEEVPGLLQSLARFDAGEAGLEDLPPAGRLVAIADAFYRATRLDGVPPSRALADLKAAHSGRAGRAVIEALVEHLRDLYTSGDLAPPAADAPTVLVARRIRVPSLLKMLEFDGFRVEDAENGDEAWELVRSLRPDLAILDVGLLGRDGATIVELSRAHPALEKVRFLLLGAVDDPSVRARLEGLDSVQLVDRSASVEALRARVSSILTP